MKTQVCITIDTEFHIGGAFSDPARYQPVAEQSVLCAIGGKSHGLDFMLETFKEARLSATFFVETFNTYYFKDENMHGLSRRIKDAGHDCQLHLHPCWTYFRQADWRSQLKVNPPNDSMAGKTEPEVIELITAGLEIFDRWKLPPPLALRTGGLRVDKAVYSAMASVGLKAASNVGLAVYRPDDTALHLYAGRHWVNGILEIPILTYGRFPYIGRGSEKTLTVTGSSSSEIEALLWAAHEAGIGPVVILTHAHEYVKGGDVQYRNLRPNRVNQGRLAKLCRFLHRNRDAFETVTFNDSVPAWLAQSGTENRKFEVSFGEAIHGIVENKMNDFLSWY